MRRIALSLNVIDSPNQEHKTHVKPVPYLGGIAIVLGTTSVTYAAALLTDFTRNAILISSAVFGPALLLSTIGLIDDVKELQPLPRFIVQNLVGAFSATVLIFTDTLGAPFGNTYLDFSVTFIWLVGLMNSINFFDNIDGGAAGSVAISSGFLAVIALLSNQNLISALALVLCGATLGFLIWNKPPARIYMGDAGSLFLGTLLGALLIRLDSSSTNPLLGMTEIVLLVGVPILDTTVVVIDRIQRRISVFKGGKDHLSHRLMRKGMNRKETIKNLWLLSAILASCALVSSLSINNLSLIASVFGLSLMLFLLVYFLKISVK